MAWAMMRALTIMSSTVQYSSASWTLNSWPGKDGAEGDDVGHRLGVGASADGQERRLPVGDLEVDLLELADQLRLGRHVEGVVMELRCQGDSALREPLPEGGHHVGSREGDGKIGC